MLSDELYGDSRFQGLQFISRSFDTIQKVSDDLLEGLTGFQVRFTGTSGWFWRHFYTLQRFTIRLREFQEVSERSQGLHSFSNELLIDFRVVLEASQIATMRFRAFRGVP